MPDRARTYRGLVERATLTTQIAGRSVELLPKGSPRDWPHFTARANGAISTLAFQGVTVSELAIVIEEVARLFGMTTTMLADGNEVDPIRFSVRAL